MTTITRISKRDENVKKLGTPSQNGLSGDAGPSPPAIPTSQVNDHNGGDLECLLNSPAADLERVIHKFIVDVDSSLEHAQLGGDPSLDHGSKQSFTVRSGDHNPSLLAADSGVAYEPSSTDEFGSGTPLLSPLFSPIDLPRPDVTAKPQALSTHILLAPRGEEQVAEASVPRPPQSSIHDTSSTTAVAGPTVKLSRPASVQDLLPVCALDIDLFSAKPRAASAPLLSPLDSSSPHTRHALSAHEVEKNRTANSASASSGQKRKPTGSTMGKDGSTPFTSMVDLSENVPNSSSAVPGSSTDRSCNGRSKQTLAEVGIPATPLSESSPPTTISATRYLDEMSEADRREIEQIIKDSIQKTGLLSAPKELIARSRMQKRKRNKNMEATTRAMGPDAPQPATPGHPSTTPALTDSQEAPAPKLKRRRTTKPKKERAIAANPYPRTTTTPPDEVPQQDYPFDAPQAQETHTDIPQAPMPLVVPSSMAPVNVESRSNGFDPAQSPAVRDNTFSTNMAPTHPSAFQHTQSTAPGSTPYSFNIPRNMGINYPQGIVPGAMHPRMPAYNPAYVNSQRLLWQRARIARQIQARRQGGFTDQRYHAPLIPNAMTMPVDNEGGWNPQAPSPPSQPLMDAGLPYFFDASQSIQGASGQPYPQYQVPNFDYNTQSGRYHMQHPLFNQVPAGPSHSLQPNGFNPPGFNDQLIMPPTGYELPFHPIHFGSERQRETDYVTRPVVPAVTAPTQNYAHTLNPSFMNHTVAPINLHDDLTTRGEIPAATSSRMRPTLPGSFIGDELTNSTQ